MNDYEKYRKFEKVRKSGLYNMYSNDAIHSTGLNRDDYFYIMDNYDKLDDDYKEQFENEIQSRY